MPYKPKPINCQNCGEEFIALSPRAKFCPACRPVMAQRRNRQWERQRQTRRKRPYGRYVLTAQPEISISEAIRMTEEAGKSYGQLQTEGVLR